MSCRLHRIGVEKNTLFTAKRAYFLDGLNGSYLVIGKHNSYKTGVLS